MADVNALHRTSAGNGISHGVGDAFFVAAVAHDAEALNRTRGVFESLTGAASGASWVIASPASDYAGPIDPGTSHISLLAPLAEEILGNAIIMPPVRYFRDAFGQAFLTHVHNSVRRGGWIAAPFHPQRQAERLGYWTVEWLSAQLKSAPEMVSDQERIAVFRRRDVLPSPRSVLSAFIRDSAGFALDFLSQGHLATSAEYLRRCEDFVVPPFPAAREQVGDEAGVAVMAATQAFLSNMNYSVTGVSYKTAGLRRLIDHYFTGRKGLRLVDIGGGAGFVSMELLLTDPRVAEAVNCEPFAANLTLNRRLYRTFEPSIAGRYKVCLAPAQEYPFDQDLDILCAFASLLLVPKDHLRQTLDRAWNALRPGGVLVIHENIKRPLFASKDYYGLMFTAQSLDDELSRYGTIEYYRSSDIAPMHREQTADLTVFRVVRKG